MSVIGKSHSKISTLLSHDEVWNSDVQLVSSWMEVVSGNPYLVQPSDAGTISYYACGSHGMVCKEDDDMCNRTPLQAQCFHQCKHLMTFHHHCQSWTCTQPPPLQSQDGGSEV